MAEWNRNCIWFRWNVRWGPVQSTTMTMLVPQYLRAYVKWAPSMCIAPILLATIYIACVYACACKLWVIVWKFRIPDTKMNKRKMQCFLPTYQQIFTNKIFHLFFFFSHENSFFYLFCPLNKYWNLLAHFT